MSESIEWRPFPDRPAYEVSRDGRLRSPNGELKLKRHPQGYSMVILKYGKASSRLVHHLVAETFLGPRPEGYVVCHKNGDKKDNRLENLMYATQRANFMHRKMHGSDPCPLLSIVNSLGGRRTRRIDRKASPGHRRGSRHGMCSVLSEELVTRIHEMSLRTPIAAQIDRDLGLRVGTSADIIAGRRWRHMHPDVTLRR